MFTQIDAHVCVCYKNMHPPMLTLPPPTSYTLRPIITGILIPLNHWARSLAFSPCFAFRESTASEQSWRSNGSCNAYRSYQSPALHGLDVVQLTISGVRPITDLPFSGLSRRNGVAMIKTLEVAFSQSLAVLTRREAFAGGMVWLCLIKCPEVLVMAFALAKSAIGSC